MRYKDSKVSDSAAGYILNYIKDKEPEKYEAIIKSAEEIGKMIGELSFLYHDAKYLDNALQMKAYEIESVLIDEVRFKVGRVSSNTKNGMLHDVYKNMGWC